MPAAGDSCCRPADDRRVVRGASSPSARARGPTARRSPATPAPPRARRRPTTRSPTTPSAPQLMTCVGPPAQAAAATGVRGRHVVDVVGGDRAAPRRGVDPGRRWPPATSATMIVPTVPVSASRPGHGPDRRGRRQGQQPGDRHLPGDAPLHRGQPRPAPAPKIEPVATCVVESAKPRCEEARMIAALLVSAAKPCGVWISLTPLAQGLDDPPTADVGAQRDGEAGGEDHPERRARVGRQQPRRDERQGDDAHRLLRVVGAVRERDHGRRDDLPELEALGDGAVRGPHGDPVRQVCRDQRDDSGDERRRGWPAESPC